MVAYLLPKQTVVGSNPITRSAVDDSLPDHYICGQLLGREFLQRGQQIVDVTCGDKACTATFGYPVGGIAVPVSKLELVAP